MLKPHQSKQHSNVSDMLLYWHWNTLKSKTALLTDPAIANASSRSKCVVCAALPTHSSSYRVSADKTWTLNLFSWCLLLHHHNLVSLALNICTRLNSHETFCKIERVLCDGGKSVGSEGGVQNVIRRGVMAGTSEVRSTFRHHAHTLARRYSLWVARREDECSVLSLESTRAANRNTSAAHCTSHLTITQPTTKVFQTLLGENTKVDIESDTFGVHAHDTVRCGNTESPRKYPRLDGWRCARMAEHGHFHEWRFCIQL